MKLTITNCLCRVQASYTSITSIAFISSGSKRRRFISSKSDSSHVSCSKDVSSQLREVMRNVPQVSHLAHPLLKSVADSFIASSDSNRSKYPLNILFPISRSDLNILHIPDSPSSAACGFLPSPSIPFSRLPSISNISSSTYSAFFIDDT